jgi:ElaB/YqjD/DUF883 family membrane-anchored ribosome-binding protein
MRDAMENLTDDASALLSATADVAEEKVVEARDRLKSALASARDTYVIVQKKAVHGAKVADKTIRDNPYYSIGIAFGVGALVGYLWKRRD